MDTLKMVTVMNDLVREGLQRKAETLQDVTKIEANNMEILHELELKDFNPFQAHQIVKHLTANQRRRRELKGEHLELSMALECLPKGLLAALGNAQAKVARQRQRHENILEDRGAIRSILETPEEAAPMVIPTKELAETAD